MKAAHGERDADRDADADHRRCAVTRHAEGDHARRRRARPATVPRLNPAWKRGMIARPRRRSTSAPCTFIATSQLPVATPTSEQPGDDGRDAGAVAEGDDDEAAPARTDITGTVRREPKRVTTGPGQRQRDHRAGGDRQQHEAEAGRAEAEVVPDLRDPRGPAGERDTRSR